MNNSALTDPYFLSKSTFDLFVMESHDDGSQPEPQLLTSALPLSLSCGLVSLWQPTRKHQLG
jgi:hypothetical protein